ncbi:ATP-binding protein [Nocardioides sp. NPDC126508]
MSSAAQMQSELSGRVSDLVASELIEELAVKATFDLEEDVAPGQYAAVLVISDRLSDRNGRQEWMLKETARVEALARVLRRGGLREARAVRRKVVRPTDSALQRVLDLILHEEPVNLEELDEDELLAALHVGRWCAVAGSLAGMPWLARELDREWIEGRLALMETMRPIEEATVDGCVGRESELARMNEYVAGPPHLNLAARPPLLVYGVGGVGKSTLIAQFLLDVARRPDPVAWAYLDLDRPSLASYDPLVLLTDLIRQVGAQQPAIRRFLDYGGSEAYEGSHGVGLEGTDFESWRGLAPLVARAVNDSCDGRLVVVLDTYEELQRADLTGSTYGAGEQLYGLFAILADYTDRFRLVISGRAPALTFVTSTAPETQQRLHVTAFQGPAAARVMEHLYEKEVGRLPEAEQPADRHLDPAIADEVVATVGGSPLTLRLAARVLALEGVAGLDDVATRAAVVGRMTDEFVAGFLYHRILGHIRAGDAEDRETLRQVAAASLALRLVTSDLLREVVFPALGRPGLDATTMLSGLLAETALADNHGGAARLRDELRGPALLALRYSRPKLVTDIHERAAAYYESHPELPGAAVELAYHRLAIGDAEALEDLRPESIADLKRSAPDLPPTTRVLVGSAEASPQVFDDELRREAGERETDRQARLALEAGDLDGAADALESQPDWSPTTRLHRLESVIAEARGDLEAAIDATRRDVAAALLAQDPARYSAAAVRLALLLERTYDPAGAVTTLTEADGQPWLSGQVLLRLELQLNRLAVLERTDDPSADAWVFDLDLRALLQKADLAAVRANTALVRLLAATLGRDEPSWVVEAVRSVGVGPATTYSSLLRDLAGALGRWDMARSEPGSVARSVSLNVREPVSAAHLGDLWFQAVAGHTDDTAPLLDRAFSIAPPDDAVLTALRSIYLEWGIAPQERIDVDEPAGEAPPEHFLDRPLDMGDAAAQRLVRAITGAYPSPADRQVLAADVGLDVAAVDVKTTRGLSTRKLLDQAASFGKVPALIGQVLADPKTAAFHDELRDLVGPEWLDQHGIDS